MRELTRMGGTYNYSSTNVTYGTASNWTPNGVPTPSDYPFIGSYTVTDASDLSTTLGGYFCFYNKANVTVNGSVIIAVAGLSTGNIVQTGATLNLNGPLVIGSGAGSNGILTVTNTNSMLAIGSAAVTIGSAGTGSLVVSDSAKLVASGSTVMLGSQKGSNGTLTVTGGATVTALQLRVGQKGNGAVSVTGTNSTLTANKIAVGGQMATPPANPGGSWTYTGGGGTLSVSGNASVFDTTSLSLLGGTININGGSLDIGGTSNTKPNTLEVDSTLIGHGVIQSSVLKPYLPELGSTPGVIYALDVTNNKTIEANDGTLQIQGSISGNGAIKIDANSTLELGGLVQATIDFQNTGTGTLVLDNPEETLLGKTDYSIENLTTGDSIVLDNTSVANGNPVVDATITKINNQLELQIDEGTDRKNIVDTFYIPIMGATDDILTSDYFQVTKSGANDQNTTLTLTQGNNIASAVNAPQAWQTGYTGQGVIVGVISNYAGIASDIAYEKSINALPQQYNVLDAGVFGNAPLNLSHITALIGENQNIFGINVNDVEYEGDSLAQIVHAVAPNATIDFYASGGDATSMADAVKSLQQAGATVIVDDVGLAGEASAGSPTDNAILNAYVKNVTYVASAPNLFQNGSPGFNYGHAANPAVIAVAAMNLLATPTSVGNYLPKQLEGYSPQSGGNNKGPDITGPDGGQAVPVTGINPFFGTSAAAPAVAAVVALMKSKNPQLTPYQVKTILQGSATPLGIEAAGSGLVNAQAALAATPLPTTFVHAPDPPTPTVVSAYLSQPSGDADSGSLVQLYVQLAEGVTVTGGTPSLTLNSGTTTATYDASASTPSTGLLVFDYTIGASDHTTDLAVTGYNANGATVTDADSTPGNFSLLFNAPTGLTINSPLTVTGITASSSGDATAGQTVHVTVSMNEALTLTATGGNPTLELNDYATATYDSGLSNLAAGKLVFDYTVAAGDETPNLAGAEVDLPTGTTITDVTGNNADFSGVLNFNTGLQIGPTFVEGYTTTQNTAMAFYSGQLVQLTLTMSSAVTVTGTPELVFDDGGIATYAAGASNPSAGTLVFDYTVGAQDESPDLYVAQIAPNGATIKDSFGNAADLSQVLNVPSGLQIGAVAVNSVTTSQTGEADTGQALQISFNMDGPVTVNTANGSPTLTLNDNATATYDADLSVPSNGTLVFDYTVGASDQTPDLEITQINPNGATIQDSDGVNVDLSAAINAPTGLSINSPLKANLIFPTNASGDVLLTGQTLDIEVELSKDVTVDTAGGSPILLMNSGGTATYDAAASYPQFGDLVFDYTVGANDYNAALAIDGLDLNGATITDASGNNPDPSSFVDTLGYGSFSTPIFVNPAYVVSGSSPTPGLVQAGQAVQLVVNMSAGVIVDTSGGTPTLSVSANGDTATYDSNASDPAAGKLVFDFTAAGRGDSLAVDAISLNGATITDDNGNPALLQGLSSNPLSFGVTDGQPQVTTVFESYNDQNVAEAATGQTIQIVLSTSDTNLTVTGAPTLSLNDGATATYNAAESDLSAGSLTFDYTVGANDATYTLLATQLKLNGGSIEDANGASLSTSLSATLSQQAQDAASINKSSNHALSASIAGPPFILDGEPASLKPPEWTTGQTSEITITTSDYETINTTDGSPTLTLSDGATATYDASLSFPNGSGVAEDTLVFDYVVGSNDISSGLSITRYNANGSVVTGAFDSVVGDLTNAAGLPVDVSQSPGLDVTINVPVVASVTTSATASSLHTGQSFTLAVFTSQAVTITGGSPTLKLNDGGVATYDSAASNLAEGMLVFDYTIAASDATQDLAISQFNPNGATIKNSMGQNALWTAPALQTPLGIEVNVPQLVSIVPSQTSPLPAGGSMTITVTMSAPLTVNTAGGSPTLSLDDGSMATYDVNASTLSAGKLVFDYTAAASDYTPDLTVVDFNLNGAVVQGTNGMNGDFSNAVQGLSVVVNAAAALGVPPTPTDFYGSGTSDILFRSDASGDTGFYQISNGANVGWQDVDGSSTAYSVVGTGDFYGTGTTDILYRDNASGDTGFYQINDGVNVGWQHIGGSSTAYNVVGVADFYGNGTDDVLFRNNATGDTGFYEIVNGAKTGWVDVDGSSTAYSVVDTGDFMGNGTDDILFRDNSTGDTGFYNIVNGVNTGWVDVGGSSTAYSVVGTGDFMGNGTDDILFRDNSTGDIGFYDIVNGVNTAWYDIGGSSSAYSVVATGDYLGNGTSDILFRNNATGDTGFYAISNGVNIGWHDVGGSSTAYHVAS
jgi:T5SS/PEP-CTERM-associated repeat protein